MTRDCDGEHIEVGDVVRLLGEPDGAEYALVEGEFADGGSLMVRRFDRSRGEWHTTRRRWRCHNLRWDPHRGGKTPGQRDVPAFVDRLKEW